MEKFRVEKDILGSIKVPTYAYWGAQTERSLKNFSIGIEQMPEELVMALVLIKKAAALTNCKLGVISRAKCRIICRVADEILAGEHLEQFPLMIWQTGSGTQTNMNVNEVIANRAIELLGGVIGSKEPIHPNDDVNKSQSTNDVFPSAIHIASTIQIRSELLPAIKQLEKALYDKVKAFKDIVKVGRTHLMDAAPLTLGQEFSGYATQITASRETLEAALPALQKLALGGTAVGTGLNAPKRFGIEIAKVISRLTGIPFQSAENKFAQIASHDAAVTASGALKRVAISLFKMANDIRLMASGPRAGLQELILPANEPGSSIMPGKVNPTQCEALTMVAIQVMGYDTAISFAGALGNFELNVYQPLIAYNLLHSIHLLTDSIESFTKRCLIGLKPNIKQIKQKLENSLMMATALNPVIGYDKATEVVKKAYSDNISLKEATIKLGFMTAKEFDRVIKLKK